MHLSPIMKIIREHAWGIGPILKISFGGLLLLLKDLISGLQEQKVDDSLEFLILASDGLWDVVTNEVCYLFLSSP